KSKVLKPLCPTRFLCRVGPIEVILASIDPLLKALEFFELEGSVEQSAKARGFYEQFSKGNTYLVLTIAYNVFSVLENLNVSLQGSKCTLSGMIEAVPCSSATLQHMRSDDEFKNMFDKVQTAVEAHGLEEICLPRRCSKQTTSKETYYRTVFYEIIDICLAELRNHYDESHEGVLRYVALEGYLLQRDESTDSDVLSYPELRSNQLELQLKLLHTSGNGPFKCLSDIQIFLANAHQEVRTLFSQVEALVRLLLLFP